MTERFFSFARRSETPGAWPLRFEIAGTRRVDDLAQEPLPLGLRSKGSERRFHRDTYFDTPSGDLERRSVSCRLRVDRDHGRLITVKVREQRTAGDLITHRAVSASVLGADTAEMFLNESDPARLLRAIVDPAQLVPLIQMDTERRIRSARWWWFPGLCFELAYDTVTVRLGDQEEMFQELKVRRLPGPGPSLAHLGRVLGALPGIRPTVTDKLQRARDLVRTGDASTLARRMRTPRRSVVLPFHFGLLGLGQRANELLALTGAGSGEEACRAVLQEAFGTTQAQVRMLGTVPASRARPPLDIWIARRIPGASEIGAANAVAWASLHRLTELVGTAVLRDPVTLAALDIAARSDLLQEQPVWEPPARSHTPPSVVRSVPKRHSPYDLALANADLSLLAFHERVLAMAEEKQRPLADRVRYLAIVGSNLDEFFMVRVGSLKRGVGMGDLPGPDGLTPLQRHESAILRARMLGDRAYRCLREVVEPELVARDVRICGWLDLDEGGRSYATQFFHEQVLPLLTPLAAAPGHPFPHVANLELALAITVRNPLTEARHFATVSLPPGLPRFLPLPMPGRFVPLEVVLCANIQALFADSVVERAHAFRITRSADLRYREDVALDLLQAVEEHVSRRPFQPVVRLEVERTMPTDMREQLLQEFRFEAAGRIIDLGRADIYEFERLAGLRTLREVADVVAAEVPRRGALRFASDHPIHSQLGEGDVLVHFPYDSFGDSVERFLVEAAADPSVAVIKVTLYRTDDRSGIRAALHRAADSGKSVTVLIELKARFDEAHNIAWARDLRAAGVQVVYGLPKIKTHTKMALVVRREGGQIFRYSYVGTGNFHAVTAGLYTDFGLFTADPAVGEEVNALFNQLTGLSSGRKYRRLLVAPDQMLPRLLGLIDREADHARGGRMGRIRAKMNGLDDPEIIAALYEASRAGVEIDLIVRGICCLRPGISGMSERVRIVSVLGPLLEHARVAHFHNGGADEYYIGSADWRTRNLRRRVEACVEVRDQESIRRLDDLLARQLDDPTAWELLPDSSWRRRSPPSEDVRGSQEVMLASRAEPPGSSPRGTPRSAPEHPSRN